MTTDAEPPAWDAALLLEHLDVHGEPIPAAAAPPCSACGGPGPAMPGLRMAARTETGDLAGGLCPTCWEALTRARLDAIDARLDARDAARGRIDWGAPSDEIDAQLDAIEALP